MRSRSRSVLLRAGLGLLVVFVLLQLLPVGRAAGNPPVRQEAPWPDARTRDLARHACYDCHSNGSRRPAYALVAPISWLVTSDVLEGREKLNFSEWDQDAGEGDDAAETVTDRSMPPLRYTLVHPDARLGAAERELLAAALAAMRADRGGNRGRGGGS